MAWYSVVKSMIRILEPTILRFESLDSTNLEAMRRAKAGAPEGLCIVASEQTRGRGRLDRAWLSPKDSGLYFSIILRPQFGLSAWPLIGLMSALAASEALSRSADLKVDIKWPNDLYANGRKLGGILSETIESSAGTAAIVGIGINLTQESLPAELKEIATSVEEAARIKPNRDLLLDELVTAMAQRYEALQNEGGAEHTVREWCANSSYAFERRVRVSLSTEIFDGTTRGLESDGALRVEDDDGKMRVVRAGDVTALRATN